MLKFWKKEGNELHIQKGLEWGNDLTCVEDGEMGTYIPLTDEEHIKRGYVEISFDEACEMAEIAGYDLKEVANVFDIDTIEMKGYGPASNYDAAHIIDPNGRIMLRVLEPESRRMDDSFPEERFRQDVLDTLRKFTEIIPPYTIQWDPGRDNAEEEFYEDV